MRVPGIVYASEKLLEAMIKQEVHHSAKRIIEDVRGTQKYDSYQVLFPEKVVIFKVKCEKITKIGVDGNLHSENVLKSKQLDWGMYCQKAV